MKAQSRPTLTCLWVTLWAAALFLLLGGCFMPYNYSSGPPIKESRVKKIYAGKTTTKEILQWFGIPKHIVRPQAQPTVSLLEVIFPGGGGLPAPPATYSELFSKHNLTEDHRIYVYTVTRTSGTMVLVGPVHSSSGHSSSDTLLVLVNEKTGLVEDHIFGKSR